jgi:hypothetical protein
MDLKLKAEIATKVVALLDKAQGFRSLSTAELSLKKMANVHILCFTALRKIKIRQRSRLQWIKLGDAHTRLFHIRANARRRISFTASLTVQYRTF